MAKLRLLAAARADLADIDEFSFAQFGHDVADKYTRGLREAFALLREHPQAGSETPELGKGSRCLVHRRHRILYRVDRDTVLIVRVIHHAMEARKAIKGSSR